MIDERYYAVKELTQEARSKLQKSVEYFDGLGISIPDAPDLVRYREYLSAQKGRKKGSLLAPKTIEDYMSVTRDYYDWLRAERREVKMFESQTAAVDSVDEAAKRASETESMSAESEALSSVDTSAVESEDLKPKRGRKPKPENADRVQVSVYLSRGVYESLKVLAQVKGLNVSDIVSKSAQRIVEQNSQTIAIAQQALRDLATLNVEI